MKQHAKLSPKQESLTEHRTQAEAALEFATAEDLLRADAAEIEVPFTIGERLKQSAANIAPPARPWWKRLFGR